MRSLGYTDRPWGTCFGFDFFPKLFSHDDVTVPDKGGAQTVEAFWKFEPKDLCLPTQRSWHRQLRQPINCSYCMKSLRWYRHDGAWTGIMRGFSHPNMRVFLASPCRYTSSRACLPTWLGGARVIQIFMSQQRLSKWMSVLYHEIKFPRIFVIESTVFLASFSWPKSTRSGLLEQIDSNTTPRHSSYGFSFENILSLACPNFSAFGIGAWVPTLPIESWGLRGQKAGGKGLED